MKPIGGFFDLEIADGNSIYHKDAIKLSTGRACLNYAIIALKPTRVYLPYYCCDALFEPMVVNRVEYEFYPINDQLEMVTLPKLKANEIIIYTDFFGIKTKYVNTLLKFYDNKLVIDNTHSFFLKAYETETFSFTSARKYFGVPDGAFLYTPGYKKLPLEIKRNTNISIEHNLHRLLGLQEKAYSEYVEYEKTLGSNIERISIYSEKVLSAINYQKIRKIRNDNFNFFRREFEELNKLNIDKDEKDCFCYPLVLDKPINRNKLYNERIFIPNLWLDTLGRKQRNNFELECKLSNELLPLPIDHRYTFEDIERVSKTIKNIIYE